MDKLFLVALSVACVLSLADSITDEYDQEAEHKSYCELVSMWEEDAERGIEPTKRDGMPNYKEIDCEL